MPEEAENLNSYNTVHENRDDNQEKEVYCLGQDREDGFEHFLGERDLVKNYIKG